jgi:hypothetical protein
MMNWRKLGLVFSVDKSSSWMFNYAAVPTAINLSNDIYRVFFSTRDKTNKSNGFFLDIDLNEPNKILKITRNPILFPGDLGSFDDSGVQICSALRIKDKEFLYYTGWSLANTIPFKTFLGLAIYSENGVLKKYSRAPIMSWTDKEPFSVGYAFVIYYNNEFKMWYESNLNWFIDEKTDQPRPEFVIKYAVSNNGIEWQRGDKICLRDEIDGRIMSRPSVLIEEGIYKMWYSYKKNGLYKIGYAESLNGIDWARKDDEVGIGVSPTGWDSEQIEYPFVFDHKGERYMLYNGNGYGKSGFGLARMIK